jgi:hypothetical protein
MGPRPPKGSTMMGIRMEFLSLSAQMTMTILPFTKVRATGHGISASLQGHSAKMSLRYKNQVKLL